MTQQLLRHVLKFLAFKTHSPASTAKQIKTTLVSHPPTHIFNSSAMQDCASSEQRVLRDISDEPYSTANDKAAALRIVITSSLEWEFLSEWRCFVLWLASLLVSVVTYCLLQVSEAQADGRGGRLNPCQRLVRGESSLVGIVAFAGDHW